MIRGILLTLLALVLLAPVEARAQTVVTGRVVGVSCGAQSLTVGTPQYIPLNTAGLVCFDGSGGGSIIVTGNQSNAGAGTTGSTNVPVMGYSYIWNGASWAQFTGAVSQSGNWNVGGLTGISQSGSLTRASNTTTYTANTAVCAFTSTTPCAPIAVTIAGANAATGTMGRVFLAKSSGVLTNANFTIYFYSAAPYLTGVYDDGAYAGPFAADLPYYLGSYTCNAFQITNDGTAQSFSECTPTAPQGWMQYKTVSGQQYVYAVIEVTAAYVPTSAGTFTIYANSYQDK